MNDKRKVVFFRYERSENGNYEKVAEGHGEFLGFGVDYEELNNGAGTFSTAIIELPDGSVKNIPVELIVFNN